MNEHNLVNIFKSLADPARLAIVRKLAKEPGLIPSCDVIKSCSSLSNLSQPAVSHHINKLVDSGVLKETKQGTVKRYTLDFDLLNKAGIDPKKI